jgi:hypothetical protein
VWTRPHARRSGQTGPIVNCSGSFDFLYVFNVPVVGVTFALAKGNFALARVTLVFELFGVISVGLLSNLVPKLFAHPSVWSYFGLGYGLIPLLLPIFGLWWIRRAKQ